MIEPMIEMINFFLPKCDENSTLKKLKYYAENQEQWKNSHDLFSEIRSKTLKADKIENKKLGIQYLFEEACAKSLYNMYCYPYDIDDPFDADSPFWVLPFAIGLGKKLGIKNLGEISSLLR